MSYQDVLRRTKELWNNYTASMKCGNTTRAAGLHRELLDFMPRFAREYTALYGRPIKVADMWSEIRPNEFDKRPSPLNSFIKDAFGGVYEFLKMSGIWEHFNGEPLERIDINGHRVLRSQRYKQVIFSQQGGSDISWVPHLTSEREATYEASCILFFSGYGKQHASIAHDLGTVDSVNIKVKPYEITYLGECVIPLLCGIFGVPDDFFKRGEKTYVDIHGNIHHDAQLQINSAMVGSYFQNIMGVFGIRDKRIVKMLPHPKSNAEIRALIRAATDNITGFRRGCIGYHMSYGDTALKTLKEALGNAGFSSSEITPILNEDYRLAIIDRDGKRVLCKTPVKSRAGKKVLSRRGKNIEEVGEIVERGTEPCTLLVELFEEPSGELYQEYRYWMRIRGREQARAVIEYVKPRNPNKLLRYLKSCYIDVPIPTVKDHQERLQEFVYKYWKGDVDDLASRLKEFVRA